MKRQALIACVFLLFAAALSAQDKDWSLGIYYPISVGDDFWSSNQGLVGANLSYRFADLGKGRLGATLDAGWFATTVTNDSDPIQELEYRDFFFQTKVFYETPLTSNEKLRLAGALGWAFQRATGPVARFNQEGQIEGTANHNGPVLSAGLSYDFAPRWYVSGQADLLLLSGDAPDRTIGLMKLGVGFRF